MIIQKKKKKYKICTDLDEVNKMPFTPPNVDMATKTGTIQAIHPYKRSANVLSKKLKT